MLYSVSVDRKGEDRCLALSGAPQEWQQPFWNGTHESDGNPSVAMVLFLVLKPAVLEHDPGRVMGKNGKTEIVLQNVWGISYRWMGVHSPIPLLTIVA